MGVLDDAIREHLELKRRHGVGEDELRRQEEEALGPARREVAPAESEDGDQTEAAQAGEPEQPVAELPAEEPVEEPAVEPTAPEVAPPDEEQVELGETPQQGFERVEEEEEAPVDDDFDDLEDDDGHADDDEFGSDEEDEEDADVLEDTPDFLQETPEHDRLWFEQKPPRDFDFD